MRRRGARCGPWGDVTPLGDSALPAAIGTLVRPIEARRSGDRSGMDRCGASRGDAENPKRCQAKDGTARPNGLNSSSHGDLSQGWLAMRLTRCRNRNRWTRAALLAAWLLASGCQRLPYLDQSKPVPHDTMGRVALEDAEVQRANLLSSTLPMQLPKLAKARTTNDPEAQDVLPVTLQEAIRIGLDNSEVVRVIAFGAQGIPVGGFEPPPLNTGAAAGVASSLGAGTLQTVYDPAILETQIATALSTFDTAFTTSILWGRNTQPFNNGIQGGSLNFV